VFTIYLAAFGAALVAALAGTPVALKAALRFGILDSPEERKIHSDPVPYLGGMAIILAFAAAVVVGGFMEGFGSTYGEVAAILAGGLVLAGIGLWDDLRFIHARVKFIAEIIVAGAVYLTGVRISLFHVPLLDLGLTVVWLVGVTNALNLLDNMDGLSAGVSAIASVCFFFLAALSGQFLVASLAAALAGCALGFLWYNRPPARIFMGDAGSLFLGFMLGVLGIKLRFANIERVTFFVPVAVLGVPILDTCLVIAARIKRGVSPFRPGQDHISHRLVRIGIPPKAAVGLLYAAAAGFGWMGIVIAYSRPLTAYMLMGGLIALSGFLGFLLTKVPEE